MTADYFLAALRVRDLNAKVIVVDATNGDREVASVGIRKDGTITGWGS